MAQKFLTDIDLDLNKLNNVILGDSAPTGLGANDAGALYYDNVNDVVKVWDGTAWGSISGDITSIQNATGTTTIQVTDGTGPVVSLELEDIHSGASTGPTGSTTTIPVITIDKYGRVTALTDTSISTTLNISDNQGTPNTDGISLASDTLTFAGGTGVDSTVNAGTNTVTFSIGQAVGTTDNVTFGTIDGTTITASTGFSGNLTGNVTGNVTAGVIQVGVTATNEIDTSSGNLIIDSAGGTVTVDDDVIISGTLTVNGGTTTVNSTTVTVDDPIFTLGGDTAPSTADTKDRGIEFNWYDSGASAAKVGFFGFDQSTGRFTFIPDATNTSEAFSGTAGDLEVSNIYGTIQTASQTNITGLGTITTGTWEATDVGTTHGGTGASTLADARTNLAANDSTPAVPSGTRLARVFSTTLTGDNSTASFTVTHNIDEEVVVQVYDATTGVTVITDVTRSSTGVTIDFNTAPAVGTDYVVVITG